MDRRQSEWDDHGEAYPWNTEGPHLFCDLTVPDGIFILSLYNMNKDGHETVNRFRDYRISIREQSPASCNSKFADFADRLELAHARCKDFWGGEYLRFLVRGPRQLTIQVNKNYSLNTILAAIALDRAEEFPQPYFGTIGVTNSDGSTTQYHAANLDPVTPSADDNSLLSSKTEEARTARKIRDKLLAIQLKHPELLCDGGRRFYAALARWYHAAVLSPDCANDSECRRGLGTCYYNLQLFEEWEEQQKKVGFIHARRIEKRLRWDGRPDTSPNENRDLVLAYRLSHTSGSRAGRQ